MIQVGVLGASGYVGAELLRLLAGHPHFKVVYAGADSAAGQQIAQLYPNLTGDYAGWQFSEMSPDGSSSQTLPTELHNLELLFLALPHGVSQKILPDLLIDTLPRDTLPSDILPPDAKIIDLAADFRLKSPDVFKQWYGQEHGYPQYLEEFSYGLPELFKDQFTHKIAVPGCYPTAAALALAPLVKAGLVATQGVIVDAASGVSGAGRALAHNTAFCTVDENFTAYGLCQHRHTPEMEQAIGAQILFTPHLAPMNRGILATCYAQPATGATLSTDKLLDCLSSAYQTAPFITVTQDSPSTKATYGSNAAHLTARFDERTGTAIAICALDNLGKGAAGQAIQCANIICGLPEESGLSAAGVYP